MIDIDWHDALEEANRSPSRDQMKLLGGLCLTRLRLPKGPRQWVFFVFYFFLANSSTLSKPHGTDAPDNDGVRG